MHLCIMQNFYFEVVGWNILKEGSFTDLAQYLLEFHSPLQVQMSVGQPSGYGEEEDLQVTAHVEKTQSSLVLPTAPLLFMSFIFPSPHSIS
jgi:hypothetical protein